MRLEKLEQGAPLQDLHWIAVFILLVIGGCLMFAPALDTSAQEYPVKSLQIIVPYAPGGGADFVARILGQKLSASFGQQVIIDNRPGAGGNIGAAIAAKAAPDGYTLVLATNTHAINASLFSKVPYDLVKDFAPITLVNTQPLVLVVHPSLPVRSVKELVALAKSGPGQLVYSSPGNGGSGHLAAQIFSSMAGINMLHVPHKGAPEAITTLLSGEVQVSFPSASSVLSLVKAGKLRALGVTGNSPVAAAPDVPTIAQAGVPGYAVVNWTGMLAPASTRRDIIGKLHSEMLKALKMPDVIERFSIQGVTPFSSTPEEFGAYIKKELETWRKAVLDSGARSD